jgi:hypothetical protein
MNLRKVVITLFALVLVAGCAAQDKPQPVSPDNALAGAPEWVLNPSSAGPVAEVGSAPKSLGGVQMQRTEALGNARDNLARLLVVKVKNSLENFSQVTGVGDSQTMDKVVASTSSQLAKVELVGATQKAMWIAKDGTMYVLVTVDPDKVAETAKKLATSSFKNEQALWQQFQAQKAQDRMSQEIEKEFGAQR